LEKLIEEDDDKTSNDKLEDQEKADASAEVGWTTIKASQNIYGSLTQGENNGKH
jgi:hypothetical protein